ncbi:MAG: hypothetical protein IKD09_04290 [Lentisphaeria bacterium]|nr:hypothetical protein [Lentisphaeria bacterium]
MITGILLSFAAGLFTIFFGIVFRFVGEKYDFRNTMICYNSVSAVVVAVGTFCFTNGWSSFVLTGVLLSALSGAINISGLMLLRRAMAIGNSGIAWSFCQASLLGPFLSGVLFYREQPSILQYGGVGLILLGLIILGSSNSSSQKASSNKYLLLAIGSFLFGCCNGSIMLTVSKITPDLAITLRTVSMSVGAIMVLLWVKKSKTVETKLSKGMLLTSLFLSLFGILSSITMLWGVNELAKVQFGGLAIPIVQGTAIGGFALYSRFFLNEVTTLLKWSGIVLIIIGIALLM